MAPKSSTPSPPTPGGPTTSGQFSPYLARFYGILAGGISVLWRATTHPIPLFALAILALVTAAVGLVVPQVPSQLNEDTAALSRWLLAESENYGWLSEPLRNLGLFNVLNSAWLRILLTVVGLLLFIQFADRLGRVFIHYHLQKRVRAADGHYNHPVALRTYAPIFRHRLTVDGGFDAVEPQLTTRIIQAYQLTNRTIVQRLPADSKEGSNQSPAYSSMRADEKSDERTNGHAASVPSIEHADHGSKPELRITGVNGALAAYVQPLLPGGLLLALFALWLIVTFGWNMTTPLLVPGDTYWSIHNVIVDYQLPTSGSTESDHAVPSVTVARGPTTVQSMISTFDNAYLGNISLYSTPAAPGLVVRTEDGTPSLSRPGQESRVSAIGLAFPADGSEETVLLPDALVGLRIIRQTDGLPQSTDVYQVETYHSSIAQPVEKFEFSQSTTVPIIAGSTTVHLEFQTAPAIFVTARYLPGTWLLWPAAFLIVLGCAGLARRPDYVVVQAYPWSSKRTLLILQSNRARTIADMIAGVTALAGQDQSYNGNQSPEKANKVMAPSDPLSPGA